MSSFKTIEHNNKIIEIHYDTDPQNPREYMNELIKIYCFHKKYRLGDNHKYNSTDFNSWAQFEEQLDRDFEIVAIKPLYMYDHSGITISTTPFSCPWDSGQIGFVFITKQDLRKFYGKSRINKKLIEQAINQIDNYVKVYDQYLRGEVYGYIVKDKNGEETDSCFGYYDIENAIADAKENV